LQKGTIFCICDEEGEIAAYTTGLDLHGFVIAKDREAYKALLIGEEGRREGGRCPGC